MISALAQAEQLGHLFLGVAASPTRNRDAMPKPFCIRRNSLISSHKTR